MIIMIFAFLAFFSYSLEYSNIKRKSRNKINEHHPPVVILPPLFGSSLYGTVQNLQTPYWFCPNNFENTLIWENEQFLVTPINDCMAEFLKCGWNSTTQMPDSRKESFIYTVDFGGDQGIRNIDHGIFGRLFLYDLDPFLKELEKLGYRFGVDLFGAPFDWRLAPIGIPAFYEQIKQLIEKVSKQTNEKVVLFSYSGGGMTAHYFLTKTVTQEWKDQYISHQVLVAPTYGGSGCALASLWDGVSWYPGSQSQSIKEYLLSLPALYSHIPNYYVHKLQPAIVGPTDEIYTYKGAKFLLYERGKVNNTDNRMTYDYSEKEVLEVDLVDPGVDSYFIFNSVLPTIAGLNFSKPHPPHNEVKDEVYEYSFFGIPATFNRVQNTDPNDDWNDAKPIFTDGDGVLSKESLYYGCNHWNTTGHTFVCHDYQVLDESFNHGAMLNFTEVVNDIYKSLYGDWKRKKGNFILEGLHRNLDDLKQI